jgi:uncharacterized membrane protein
LIFKHPIFGFCLENATLHQSHAWKFVQQGTCTTIMLPDGGHGSLKPA